MSKSVMISMLRQGSNGNEILSILDSLTSDSIASYDVIESPMIEQVLGMPTLETIDF